MKSIIKLIFLVLLSIAALSLYFSYDAYQQQSETLIKVSAKPEQAVFDIKKGSGIGQIANKLAQQKIIPNALNFKMLARMQNKSHQLKAGEYQLLPSMSITDLLNLFVSGKTLQYQLSIIEGKTFKDLYRAIRQHPSLVQTLSDADYQNIMLKLGSTKGNPEGWFYPDTYNFPRKTTDLQFLQRAHKKMQQYLQTAWQKREKNSLIKTPYEALILASMVEKETGVASERALIAGVFFNRLKIDMLLQTDPTVIYGMGDQYTGNIRKVDLKRDTPYNTYTRKGLTPTPIATPSLDAIQAVFHPRKTEAFYFVADGLGGHNFSKTYQEHKKAVAKYLLNRSAKR
jgi:UPF0755 protein